MASQLLFVTQAYDPTDPILGFTCDWIDEFANHWPKVHVVCRRATKLSSARIQIHVVPERGLRRIWAIASLSWHLRKQVQSVFVHMIPTPLAALGWWWRLLGWRIGLWYTHGGVSWPLRFAMHWTHLAFTASKESLRLSSKKIRIVGHGIDLQRFSPDASIKREAKILYVGRLTPRKNAERFLEIVSQVRKFYPALKAMIVGTPRLASDEAYASKLRLLTERLGLSKEVIWAGDILGEALVDLYRSSALLLSTSKTGSLDKVVLEALACETPVVAIGEEYKDIPGVEVVATDQDLQESVLRILKNRQTVQVRSFLEEYASLPVLVERIVKELAV